MTSFVCISATLDGESVEANDRHDSPDLPLRQRPSVRATRFSSASRRAGRCPKRICRELASPEFVDECPHARLTQHAAIFHHLGERLLEAPQDGRVPTYQEAVNSNRNIIFGVTTKLPQPAEKYIWHVGGDTKHWMGDGDQMLWNEPTWQSGDVTKVLASTEDFMRKNRDKTLKRDRFWVAFLQLTPVLGQSISTFIKDGGSVRPKDLALGGGLGTHGAFEGSNQKVRDSGVFQKPIWKNNASCILYDFCDIKTTGAIVAMNIGAEFSGAGPGGRAGEEHNGPGRGERGGRGGRGGGRGGRGDHDGPSEPRFDDGRPGERGEGRGEHRGARGGRGRGEHERFE